MYVAHASRYVIVEDVDPVFIRKAKLARDTHFISSFNGKHWFQHFGKPLRKAKLPNSREIICSRDYSVTIGGVTNTSLWLYGQKKTNPAYSEKNK